MDESRAARSCSDRDEKEELARRRRKEKHTRQILETPSGLIVRLALSSDQLGGLLARTKSLLNPSVTPSGLQAYEMWRLLIVIGTIAIAKAGPYDRTADSMNDRTADSMNDRTLYIRSLPGYPGTRSDLYEVYMEPYYFVRTYIYFLSF